MTKSSFILFTRIIIILLGLISSSLPAQTLSIDDSPRVNLSAYTHYLEDPKGSIQIEDLLAADSNHHWSPIFTENPNFGFVTSTYWFRVNLENNTADTLNRLLEIPYPLIDYISLYEVDEHNNITKQTETGDHYPFKQRPLNHRTFLFPIDLKDNNTKQIFIKVSTSSSMQVSLNLWQSDAYHHAVIQADRWDMFYYGIIVAMICVNTFLLFTLMEITYLWYILFVGFYALTVASLKGTGFQYLWPNLPLIQEKSVVMVIPIALLFACLFARQFLQLKYIAPRLNTMMVFLSGLSVTCIILSLLLPYMISIKITTLAATIPVSLSCIGLGPYLWHLGHKSARFFTIAWLTMTCGSLVIALNKLGVLPVNFFTENGFQIGSALEAILLTIALADRFNIDRREKNKAQKIAMKETQQRLHLEQSLLHQATHHPRTGLPNSAYLESTLTKHIADHSNNGFATVLLHLGHFHEINKTLGHVNADALLLTFVKHFCERVSALDASQSIESINQYDQYVASIEGVTFAFLLAETNVEHIEQALSAFLSNIKQPLEVKGMQIELGVRMGVSLYPEHSNNYSELLRNAQVALESTKKLTSLPLAFYSKEIDSYNERRLALMGELKKAIRDDSLELYFQPKYCLKKQTVYGLEALLRWNHPGFGFVPPDEFIPIAEKTGVIHELTRWVMEQSLQAINKLADQGFNLSLSINISTINLNDNDFADYTISLFQKYQVAPENIILEITETAVSSNVFNMIKILQKIKNTGVKISIDDFGTGYSSLSYIKDLPVEEIKIDKSLIIDINKLHDNKVIVKTAVDMGHGLGFQVVAEGVEDFETLKVLKEIGCDYIQGYYLAKPLPLQELFDWQKLHNSSPLHMKT
jgi:diguanylate cyclase (GGDEF)-like protein